MVSTTSLTTARSWRCSVRPDSASQFSSRASRVGKTEAAKALAAALQTPLVRLQCYEGIDIAEALYEWNYPKQLLAIRIAEARGIELAEDALFSDEFLIARPLLAALRHPGPRPAVLLIDEVDRADDDFEAFLLELLGEGAVTIPELGTVHATHRPIVVLTSNRTRELHDALKRRCLFHWIEYPSAARAAEIVRRRCRAAREPSPNRQREPSNGFVRSTCRNGRASPKQSTGSLPWSCSASPPWTQPRWIGRSVRC